MTAMMIDGEAVVVDPEAHLIGLGDVSLRIWQHLETPLTKAELLTALERDYWASHSDCERLATPILDGMVSRAIVLEGSRGD
jgi:hypothetical protein